MGRGTGCVRALLLLRERGIGDLVPLVAGAAAEGEVDAGLTRLVGADVGTRHLVGRDVVVDLPVIAGVVVTARGDELARVDEVLLVGEEGAVGRDGGIARRARPGL